MNLPDLIPLPNEQGRGCDGLGQNKADHDAQGKAGSVLERNSPARFLKMALMQNRYGNEDLHDPKVRRRAVGFLQRRGYQDAVITELLKITPNDQ